MKEIELLKGKKFLCLILSHLQKRLLMLYCIINGLMGMSLWFLYIQIGLRYYRDEFPPSQTLEVFYLGESIPVNEKLSEIFLQLHISEKSGRGIPTIIQSYGKEAIEIIENSIVIKIPFHWINVIGNKVGNKIGKKKKR